MPRPSQTQPLTIRETDDYVPTGLPASKTVTAGAVKDFKAQRTELFRPRPAGYNDPVAVALVMDLLLRLSPDSRIQSGPMTDQLNMLYPQFLWSSVTVGKILANLAEATKSAQAPDDDQPFRATKRRGTTVYRLSATLMSWRWLMAARGRLGALATQSLAAERGTREPSTFEDFPWGAFDHSWGA
jgi:hypothetical protein